MSNKGDNSSRTPPSTGASLPAGLSERVKITESPEALGMGRNETNGKPKGPQKGSLGTQKVS